MSLYDGMLPEENKSGRIGYYPVTNKAEWDELPAVYKAMDWEPMPDPFDKNKRLRAVKSVIFDVVYMKPYGIRAEVSVHPEKVHEILFCNHGKDTQCQLYIVSGVVLEGGTRLNAKWLQDSTTGAFGVFAHNHCVGKQGGFSGYVPERIERAEDGSFRYKQHYRSEGKTSHYSYTNPFERMGAVKEEVSPEKKLIEAMCEYGLDNSWNDSEVIDALTECGITQDDFVKHGYGDFVKDYFEDECPLNEVTSICVYKDVLGYQDDNDNLTEIRVPTEWLINVLKEENISIDEWIDIYTADSTVDIASRARAEGVILGCSDENINIVQDKPSLETQMKSAEALSSAQTSNDKLKEQTLNPER